MKNKKRIFSFLLVCLLCSLTLVPTLAFAETEENGTSVNSLAQYCVNVTPEEVEAFDFASFSASVEQRVLDDMTLHNVLLDDYTIPVKIVYLERIENTSFAHKVYRFVKIPVGVTFNEGYCLISVNRNIVADALGFSSFGVLQSYCSKLVPVYSTQYSYTFDKIPTFEAVYYDTVYLNVKSAEGNFCNFYLDCNQSVADYFAPLISLGIVEQSDYEVFVNSLYNSCCPHLDKFSPSEIYGYWCAVPIPQMRTLSELLTQIFSSTTFNFDVKSLFTIQHHYDDEAWETLMDNYSYSKFTQFLNTVSSWFSSDSGHVVFVYVFYVDGGETELLVARNGATSVESTTGAGTNLVVDGATKLFEALNPGQKLLAIFGTIILVLVVLVLIARLFKGGLFKKKRK